MTDISTRLIDHATPISVTRAGSLGKQDAQSLKDYDTIRRSIEYLTLHWQEQPTLDELASHVSLSSFHLQKLFTRWTGGLSPKGFVQAVTLDHAKRLLDQSASILETSFEVGLSGPSRLHDLFVTHEAITPGTYKAKGKGLILRFGFHPSPFGQALIMISEHGLAGLAFADQDKEAETMQDMQSRWPQADYIEDMEATRAMAEHIFNPAQWQSDRPLRITMIGTDFEIRVWESLLKIPFGSATTYSDIAKDVGNPKASRAVGSAVGRNPISFVVPCHRVLAKGGKLGGYHWGLTRKQAILGWEAGHLV